MPPGHADSQPVKLVGGMDTGGGRAYSPGMHRKRMALVILIMLPVEHAGEGRKVESKISESVLSKVDSTCTSHADTVVWWTTELSATLSANVLDLMMSC